MRLESAILIGSHRKIQEREQVKRQKIHKLSSTQKKQATQNTAKQNKTSLV